MKHAPGSHWARSMATRWPLAAGSAAFLLGLLMLAAAAVVNHQASELVQATSRIAGGSNVATAFSPTATSDVFLSQLPLDATHLDDASWIFKAAKEQGVSLGAIAYRIEPIASLPVNIRSMEIRADGEYPKLKAFVAQLLRELPHLYLDELRAEQASGPTSKVQATLKVSLVYRDASPRPPPGANVGAHKEIGR